MMNEERIAVKSFYHWGGSKQLYIGDWILVDQPKKDQTGEWCRTIMSPNGWLYRDYWRDGGKHELQVIYHPPYSKKEKKKFNIDNYRAENTSV